MKIVPLYDDKIYMGTCKKLIVFIIQGINIVDKILYKRDKVNQICVDYRVIVNLYQPIFSPSLGFEPPTLKLQPTDINVFHH